MNGPAVAAAIRSLAIEPLRSEAIEYLCQDGHISIEMAIWALDSSTFRYTDSAVNALPRRLDWVGRDVAVLLAASVPTAPMRAIALPLLQGAHRVWVRPSRRAPRFARLVQRAIGDRVAIIDTPDPSEFLAFLTKKSIETLIAFGSDESIASIRSALPSSIRLEAKRHGFGASLVLSDAIDDPATSEHVARDIAYFDQNGCLSPQVVMVENADASPFAARLARSLDTLGHTLPRAPLSANEASRIHQWQGAIAVISKSFHRGHNYSVASLADARFVGTVGARNITVIPGTREDWVRVFEPHANELTCIGIAGSVQGWSELTPLRATPRLIEAGQMQDPPLDGPEDPRH